MGQVMTWVTTQTQVRTRRMTIKYWVGQIVMDLSKLISLNSNITFTVNISMPSIEKGNKII